MRTFQNVVVLIGLISLCCMGYSCKSNLAGFGRIPDVRDVQVGTDTIFGWGQGDVEGVTIAFTVIVSGGEIDKGVLSQDLATKVEIDPGDGTSWLDFTQGYLNPANPTFHIGTHLYSEPGTYLVRTRVTYWDGEVFVDDGLGQRIITVFPAPDEAQ